VSGAPRYQPFYCEENVWWQVHEAAGRRWALFVTNAQQRVLLWHQRLAAPEEPVLWDYHVVMVREAHGARWIHDLDTRLPSVCPAEAYLEATFPYDSATLPEALQPFVPCFRLVPAEDLVATFASDRSHMLTADGAYVHPPPPWPSIEAADGESPTTLARYLDPQDDIAGEVMTLPQLRAWAAWEE